MRKSKIERNTFETKIKVELNIDGTGKYENNTGVGFLDHMLDLFAKHGRFNLKVYCDGDTQVDDHHSTEDIGIALGKCFYEALGDLKGVKRYGNFLLPMDEALTLVAVDLSGRYFLNFDVNIPTEKVGTFDTELVEEFFIGFTRHLNATLHIIESIFKGVARALAEAVSIDEKYKDEIPSTKGVLV